MTFFEQELRKIVGASYPNARYVGRAAYVEINRGNIVKIEFVTQGYADHYSALRASIINWNDGQIDSVTMRFSDYFAPRRLPMGRELHAWTDNGKTDWYGFTPSGLDYANLISAVRDYTRLFETQSPVMQEPSM